MCDHKTVKLYFPRKDREVDIDEGIAELIEVMWDLGFNTKNSCEDNSHTCEEKADSMVWIEMDSIDAVKFLTILAMDRDKDLEEGQNSLYNRFVDSYVEGASKPIMLNHWSYSVIPDDIAEIGWDLEKDEPILDGPSRFRFMVSIRFPKTDYPEVLERLKRYQEIIKGLD